MLPRSNAHPLLELIGRMKDHFLAGSQPLQDPHFSLIAMPNFNYFPACSASFDDKHAPGFAFLCSTSGISKWADGMLPPSGCESIRAHGVPELRHFP
jgi:hypothetical protein